MAPWTLFFPAGLLLTLVILGGLLLLPCHKRLPVFITQKLAGEARLLYWFLWMASLSILTYIAFAFGKR